VVDQRVIRILDSPAALYRAGAEEFAARIAGTVRARGSCAIALSGGSTPRGLLELLAESPYRERTPWSDVEFFWSDERAVDPDHPASNFRMAREALLEKLEVPAERVHRMPAERADLDAAACDYQRELARTFGVPEDGPPPRLDLVLLGMGADAHTASLFPRTPALRERLRWVVPSRAPMEPCDRLTFTFPLINRARCVLFLVVGADKAAPLAEVLEGARDLDRLPSQRVDPEDGRLLWLVDEAAASRLRLGAA
jgi:6-phosphogluconolactonase